MRIEDPACADTKARTPTVLANSYKPNFSNSILKYHKKSPVLHSCWFIGSSICNMY